MRRAATIGGYMSRLLAVAILIAAPVAQATSPDSLSPQDLADIERIEAYLNSFDSLEARFVQMSSTGQVAEGDFLLSKPGKLRIDYDPPVPMQIIANGLFLVYEDTELEQQTHVPLASTPVGILVNEDITLNNDEIAVTAVDRGAAFIEVAVIRKDEPNAGEVRLVFSDRPLALKRWVVTDAQGVRTNFALLGALTGVDIDPDLFIVENKFPKDRQ
ncbi:MAG: outer membrane lipoprotein carrier protein LolA [Rhodospirillales bacterium]